MILSPSMLASDFGNFRGELQALESAGLKWVHWDVMDGLFVPNITFGPPIIKAMRPVTNLFFDVHLMIEKPERFIKDFAEAGANMLVVHQESTTHLCRTLDEIRAHGMQSGVALNPSTPLETLDYVFDYTDMILIMSVNPGFGGQSFMPLVYNKISSLKERLLKAGSKALIQVDGGVDPENTPKLLTAGADVLVSGSAFFKHPPYDKRLQRFEEAAKLLSK